MPKMSPLLLWAGSPAYSLQVLHATCLNVIREGLALCPRFQSTAPQKVSWSTLLWRALPHDLEGSLR